MTKVTSAPPGGIRASLFRMSNYRRGTVSKQEPAEEDVKEEDVMMILNTSNFQMVPVNKDENRIKKFQYLELEKVWLNDEVGCLELKFYCSSKPPGQGADPFIIHLFVDDEDMMFKTQLIFER